MASTTRSMLGVAALSSSGVTPTQTNQSYQDPRCDPRYDGPRLPASECAKPAPMPNPVGAPVPMPTPDCNALLPSWMKKSADAGSTGGTIKRTDVNNGVLPAIKPLLVRGPYHSLKASGGSKPGGPTLATAQSGVYAVLYKSEGISNFKEVQRWDNPVANIALAKGIYNARPFQLQASQALAAGDYYLVIYPTGVQADAVDFMGGANALGPMLDSVVNYLSTTPTFSVDSAGSVAMGNESFSVLVDVNFVSEQFETSKTLECTKPLDSIDPLMIDFSGKGIQLSSQAHGINFDMKGDGQFERVSWPTNSLNMFLIHDKNGTGQVSGANLFGNYTMGPDGKVAANGFEALQKYDLNHDGVIDTKDSVFRELRLWSDANRDGLVQAGELKTLEEMGVTAIEIRPLQVSETDIYGNKTSLRAVIQMASGIYRIASDIWFRVQN